MPALSERKTEIVRTLVQSAPDGVVAGLQRALAETMGDSALAGVRRLVESEARDRKLRNLVLQPIAPMCVGDGRETVRITFPAPVLGGLWRGLKSTACAEVERALAAIHDYRPGERSAEPFDVLVRLAAQGVRERTAGCFAQAAELADDARPGGAELLAACLDLGPILRGAIHRLPDWTSHVGEQTAASARLAYKDAVAIADDAGPRFFEILAAHMPQPWMVLRVISSVMDKPTESYLATSEMAGFGERVIAEIDDALRVISLLSADGGPVAARRAGKLVELVTLQTSELESCIDLQRDHGWGARILKQKKALASAVESRLREAEKLVLAALPMHSAKLGRMLRTIPKLTTAPEEQAVARAMTLLTFVEEIRYSANYGGFASARVKMVERLGDTLDHYVEEVLELMKSGEAVDDASARAYLSVVADFTLLIVDSKAADLVRRRAAAAPPVKAHRAA